MEILENFTNHSQSKNFSHFHLKELKVHPNYPMLN